MPDIEGVPYEATGGKVDQATAQALAARHREAATAGVTAAGEAVAPVQAQVNALSAQVDSAVTDAKAYTDQKVTGLATTVAMNAADALTLSNAKTYTDSQLADFDSFVGVPIFETLAEAEAWEAENPGRTALTTEDQTGPITPPAPTADDQADTYTIPSRTGVEYLVGGVVTPAGTYTVGNVDTTVTVTARATGERPLTGDTVWPFTFTRRPIMQALIVQDFEGIEQVPLTSIPSGGESGGDLVLDGAYMATHPVGVQNGELVPSASTNAANRGSGVKLTPSVEVVGQREQVFTVGYRLPGWGSYIPSVATRTAMLHTAGSRIDVSMKLSKATDGNVTVSFSGNAAADTSAKTTTLPADAGSVVVRFTPAAVIAETMSGDVLAETGIKAGYTTLHPTVTPSVSTMGNAYVTDLRFEVGS